MNTESPILTTVSTLTSFSSVAGDVAPVLAGSEVEGEFLPGYMCCGVPILVISLGQAGQFESRCHFLASIAALYVLLSNDPH